MTQNDVQSEVEPGTRGPDGRWVGHPGTGRQWKPGETGNPGGQPLTLTGRLKRHLAEHPEEAEDIIRAAIKGAKEGDAKMLSIVLDRHDGLLKQQLEMSGHVVSERRIVIVGAMAEQPALPASILQLEAQREEAEQRAQVSRAREVEDEGEGS